MPPTGDLARNPGICPDWESNQRPFGPQAGAQSTEPHQAGLGPFLTELKVGAGCGTQANPINKAYGTNPFGL